MTITEQPPNETLLPYWLDRPCPTWCQTGHHDGHCWSDRVHSGGSMPEIELSLEPGTEAGGQTFPAFIGARLWMYYRDARPLIYLIVNDREEIRFELPEARELARLLAHPPREWATVTLTMMDADPALPSGFGEKGDLVAEHETRFTAFPFTWSPVAAVRQVLDSVTIFCPVQTDPDRDQALRYLAFTLGEAAELADMITRLLDNANTTSQEAAIDQEKAPAAATAEPCPPWCEIDDHDDYDGEMRHATWVNIALSSYPYEVTSNASGRPVTTQCSDFLIVTRAQLRDHEPAVIITMPSAVNGIRCVDPNGHIGVANSQALLVPTEAQEAAVALY
jgi:hypothetical protein